MEEFLCINGLTCREQLKTISVHPSRFVKGTILSCFISMQ